MSTSTLFLPVQMRNVFAFFVQGFVMPAEGLPKYRTDVLERSPGRVPLFSRDALPAELGLRSEVTPTSEVIIELEAPADLGLQDEPGNGGSHLYPGIIPVTSITAIHLATPEQRDEMGARAFSNVDGRELPLRISTDLWPETKHERPESDATPANEPVPHDWDQLRKLQAVGGAVLVLLSHLPAREPILESSVRALEPLLGSDPVDDDSTAGALRAAGWLTSDDDEAVMRVVIDVVSAAMGPERLTAAALIAEIKERLAHAPVGDVATVASMLDRIESIDRGTTALGRFRQRGGLRSVKSLLLFALRPDLQGLESWRVQAAELDTEDEVMALTAFLVGLSFGLPHLEGQVRRTPVFPLALDWIAARFAGGPNPLGNWVIDRVDHALVLASGTTEVARWENPETPIPESWFAMPETDDELAIAVARDQGWNECVEFYADASTVRLEPGRGKVIRLVFDEEPKLTAALLPDSFVTRVARLERSELSTLVSNVRSADAAPRAKPKRKRPAKRAPVVASQDKETLL